MFITRFSIPRCGLLFAHTARRFRRQKNKKWIDKKQDLRKKKHPWVIKIDWKYTFFILHLQHCFRFKDVYPKKNNIHQKKHFCFIEYHQWNEILVSFPSIKVFRCILAIDDAIELNRLETTWANTSFTDIFMTSYHF